MGPNAPRDQPAVRKTFTEALYSLVEEVKRDASILAAILCGSLSHDAVWEKSDIDLVLVSLDGAAGPKDGVSLYADGVNVHALVVPRAEFRKAVEGSIRHSFLHSFLAKGRLLYTHDPTIGDLFASLADLGARDRQLQLLRSAIGALGPINKAHKWMVTRGDLEYTALWILYAATPLARIEVIGRGLLADREVIPQAASLNPSFFTRIYSGLLNAPKTHEGVQTALDAVDALPRRARDDALCPRDRAPAGGGRSALVHRDRGSLPAGVRRRRCGHRVRVPGRGGVARQGLRPRAPHEEEQRPGAGAGVLPHRPVAGARARVSPARGARKAEPGRPGKRANGRPAARGTIAVQGARVHNLRNLSIELPRDRLIVLTGLSGSGKSSLAFDTIYAEGQRRYMESLSSYAKRFVSQVAKPDVDFVFGLSPVISIEQKTLSSNPRSTVGTMTDISGYLNLLYATIGQPHCPRTGEPTPSRTSSQILEAILSLPEGADVELRAPGLQGLRRRPGVRLHRDPQEGLPAADRRRHAGRSVRGDQSRGR